MPISTAPVMSGSSSDPLPNSPSLTYSNVPWKRAACWTCSARRKTARRGPTWIAPSSSSSKIGSKPSARSSSPTPASTTNWSSSSSTNLSSLRRWRTTHWSAIASFRMTGKRPASGGRPKDRRALSGNFLLTLKSSSRTTTTPNSSSGLSGGHSTKTPLTWNASPLRWRPS